MSSNCENYFPHFPSLYQLSLFLPFLKKFIKIKTNNSTRKYLDVVQQIIESPRDVCGRLSEFSKRRFVVADVAARRHAAFDGLGDLSSGLDQLLLAEGIGDGGSDDLCASHKLARGESALSGGSNDLRQF
jgi:hypothetical protein